MRYTILVGLILLSACGRMHPPDESACNSYFEGTYYESFDAMWHGPFTGQICVVSEKQVERPK